MKTKNLKIDHRVILIFFLIFLFFSNPIFASSFKSQKILTVKQIFPLGQVVTKMSGSPSEEAKKIDENIARLQKLVNLQKKYEMVTTIIIILTFVNILSVFLYFRSKRRDAQFLKKIINALNHPLFVLSPKNKRIELENFIAEKEFANARNYEELHKGHELAANEWLEQIMEERQPIVHEVTKYNQEGKIKYYQINLYPLFNRKGNVKHVIEYWIDITVQKKALERLVHSTEALKHSKDEFEKVIASIPDALYSALINKTGKIIDSYYSPVIENITGYPASYFDGEQNTWATIVHPDDLPLLRKRNAKAIVEKQKQARTEYRIIHKNGEIRYIRSSVTFNYLENGLIRADGILMDVTEMKKAEIELMKIQKLESIGVLAGGIAHDFNNILTAILGNISLARMMSRGEGKVDERLAEAEKACLRAKDLTQQLLTFSKGGTPVKKTTSLTHLLKEASTFLLRGSNVKPHFDFSDNLWLVEADEGQLAQVINNLVINAKQAMPEGGILKIRAYNYYHDGRTNLPLEKGKYVCFSIKDTGIGIDDKFLENIFDPYFTTKKTGSGLGLAVTFSIIKKHKGYITVQSKMGVGTTFFVYLPASDKKVVESGEESVSITQLNGRVLLMDDEEFIREVGSEMLEKLGLDVEAVKDGSEAVTKYKEAMNNGQKFDLVILDLTVPGGKGGKDTIEELRSIDEDVVAIVSSGYSNDPILANFSDYGFKGYVSKPYRMEEISAAIQKVISKN